MDDELSERERFATDILKHPKSTKIQSRISTLSLIGFLIGLAGLIACTLVPNVLYKQIVGFPGVWLMYWCGGIFIVDVFVRNFNGLRLFRFSLRTMLVFLTVFALAFGVLELLIIASDK